MQFTLSELWAHMGIFARLIVFAMGLMSIVSLVVAGERVAFFRRSRNESRAFATKMGAILARGDLDDAAVTNLGADIGEIGRVIGAGLAAYGTTARARGDLTVDSVQRALERQSAREAQSMKRGLGVLATVASTAPFVGLLGTVMGIVSSFQQMAATGSGGLGTVSGGISEALITTAFGLLVAIPAVVLYNFLQGWVDARSVDISESANEFLDIVARHVGTPRNARRADDAARAV